MNDYFISTRDIEWILKVKEDGYYICRYYYDYYCCIVFLLLIIIIVQTSKEGGFRGRTNKLVDSCYSYWQVI